MWKTGDINSKDIDDEDKIWRIKSLRVSVDEDTRILLLPIPESKREKKLLDTRYTLQSYQDIYERYNQKQSSFEKEKTRDYKRFEDKSTEEIEDDVKHKRRTQFQTMTKVRKYQFFVLFGCIMFYVLLWKRIAPKPILGSTIYNQALEVIRKSKLVQSKVGDNFMVVSCTGKHYPLLNPIDFEIVTKGPMDQAKFLVKQKKVDGTEDIESIYMLTKSNLETYKI